MKKIAITILVIMFIMITGTIGEVLAADTPTETIVINTAEELKNFAKQVNQGNNYQGITVELASDIDLKGTKENQWIPIGGSDMEAGNQAIESPNKKPFKGTFDGKNHTISGMYIDNNESHNGLFGLNEGKIRNLSVKNSYIKSRKAYAGGIAAISYQGEIENCYNEATIDISSDGSGANGGIVGNLNLSDIKHCVNKGKITGENTGGIAGIAGYSFGSIIEDSWNLGEISGNVSYVGGIVAMCQTTDVFQCYNTGKITGIRKVGGIASNLTRFANMGNCYNAGTIQLNQTEGKEGYIGGLISDVVLADDSYKVANCYNVGEIKVNGQAVKVGSLIGNCSTGIVTNCYTLKSNLNPCGNDNTGVAQITAKTSEEMKTDSFCKMLIKPIDKENNGAVWIQDLTGRNQGYPIFEYQNIKSMTLNTDKVKKEYQLGEKLDTTGLIIQVVFEDGLISDFEQGYISNTVLQEQLGEQEVEINFAGTVLKYRVKINEKQEESTSTNETRDNTIANTILPNAGKGIFIILAVIILLSICVFIGVKWRSYHDIK